MRGSLQVHARRILIAGIAMGFVVLLVAYAFAANRSALEQTRVVDDQSPLAVTGIDGDDHIIAGEIGAPLQIIVYTDLDCPYCKRLYQKTLPDVEKQFGNNIVIAFRHLPLAKHPAAYPEAVAAECVFTLGGKKEFDAFIQNIYASPLIEGPIDVPTLARFASGVGVGKAAFNTCVQTQSTAARVRRDVVQGAIAGLDVTPSVVLKTSGRSMIIKGDYPSQIVAGISYLLEKK